MKPLIVLAVAAGIAVLITRRLRQPATLPPRPAGSWEPADIASP